MTCRWHCCTRPPRTTRPDGFCGNRCKNKFYVDRRRKHLRKMAVVYKGGDCIACGYSRCPSAMDFHHLNSAEKEFRIGSGNTRAWELVRAELDKCVLLCCRCHREHHNNMLDLDAAILARSLSPTQGQQALHEAGMYEHPSRTTRREAQCACGKRIWRTSTHCRSCAAKRQPKKIKWPSFEDLQRRVSQSSFREVGRELGVSDNAIRKHLQRSAPDRT